MSIPSSSDAVATSALSSPDFNRCSASKPMLARETAVMRRDVLLADSFPKMSCDSLRKPARVDENERGVVLANQLRESIVNFVPNLAGHHG